MRATSQKVTLEFRTLQSATPLFIMRPAAGADAGVLPEGTSDGSRPHVALILFRRPNRRRR
jgi:hypothetical protein